MAAGSSDVTVISNIDSRQSDVLNLPNLDSRVLVSPPILGFNLQSENIQHVPTTPLLDGLPNSCYLHVKGYSVDIDKGRATIRKEDRVLLKLSQLVTIRAYAT